MLFDNAAVESNLKKFVKRIIESETVYYLLNENGVANSVSNDIEETVILMFWSDRAYTTRANHSFEENYNETEMELFNKYETKYDELTKDA